ncbi:MAG: 50S ribosomal protein L7/L12 [Deltaproteobacteria bacterium]|nr:MAG: 50S ribosomal protein L7/L12 [Deltaproteobacteria bacterium]
MTKTTVDHHNLVQQLGQLKITEVLELVRHLEKEWGVSAQPTAAPMVIQPPVTPPEPSSVKVLLTDYGANKIQVIKEVRTQLGLSLKEAKTLVDSASSAPVALKEDLDPQEAAELQAQFTAAGATVEVK